MPKFNGTLMALYLSATEPTNPELIGEYTKAGSSKDLNISRSRAAIDLSDKDSGLDTDAVSGRRANQISCTLNLHDDDQPGQVLIETAYNSTRGELWFLATQNASGTRQYWGKLIVTQADLNWPEESAAQMSFGADVVGALETGLVA